MRKVNGIETVPQLDYDGSGFRQQIDCDRLAGEAVRKTVIAKLSTMTLQSSVRIATHGSRRVYESSLMVGTEAEYKDALRQAENSGTAWGLRQGREEGRAAALPEGHRQGVRACMDELRNRSRWQRLRWVFS